MVKGGGEKEMENRRDIDMEKKRLWRGKRKREETGSEKGKER